MLLPIPQEWMHVGTAAAAAAVTQLWQGAAVAAGLAVCLRLAPRTHASHRFALWMGAFALVVLLPWAAMLPAFFGHTQSQTLSAAPASAPWFRFDLRWGLAVAALWALLALLRLSILFAGALRARSLWKSAQPLAAASSLAPHSLPLRAPVEICTSSQLERPSVIGFFQPRILIPDWLAGSLSAGELRQIVLHEFEHLRRCDDWTNLAFKLAVALLPLNPALWWMERELGREREMATDEAVVRRTRAPRAYAACLALVAERRLQMRFGQGELLELGIWRRRPELAERILSLLRTRETIGPIGRTALVAVLVISLAGAGVLLARSPQLVAFAPLPQLAQAAGTPQLLAATEAVQIQATGKAKAHAACPLVVARPSNQAQADAQPTRSTDIARMEPSSAAEPASEPERWVVLAVVEQRVTVGSAAQLRADYGANAADSAAQPGDPASTEQSMPPIRTIWKLLPVVPVREGLVILEL